MRRMRQRLAVAALAATLAAALGASGCVPTGPDGARGMGVSYAQGYSYGMVHAEPERVLEAAREVFNEREMYLVDEEMDRPSPRLTAYTPANRRVRVMVKPRMQDRAELWVRYGTLAVGNRGHSDLLHQRIAEVAERDEVAQAPAND